MSDSNTEIRIFKDPLLGKAVSSKELHARVGSRAYYTTWLRGRIADLQLQEGVDVSHGDKGTRDASLTVLAAIKVAASHFYTFKTLDDEFLGAVREAKIGLAGCLHLLSENNYAYDSALLRHLQAKATAKANLDNGSDTKVEYTAKIEHYDSEWPKRATEATEKQHRLYAELSETLLSIDALLKTKVQNAKNRI